MWSFTVKCIVTPRPELRLSSMISVQYNEGDTEYKKPQILFNWIGHNN